MFPGYVILFTFYSHTLVTFGDIIVLSLLFLNSNNHKNLFFLKSILPLSSMLFLLLKEFCEINLFPFFALLITVFLKWKPSKIKQKKANQNKTV